MDAEQKGRRWEASAGCEDRVRVGEQDVRRERRRGEGEVRAGEAVGRGEGRTGQGWPTAGGKEDGMEEGRG